MMQHNDEGKIKQTYEKPRLRLIELAAEEVLGVSCKTNPTVTAKVVVGNPVQRCGVPACADLGS
jgi:hypothetical protein